MIFLLVIFFYVSNILANTTELIGNETLPKNYQIYYDKDWNPVPLIEDNPSLKTRILRFGFLPCSCQDATCGCCVNMNFFSTKREVCTKLFYESEQLAIGIRMEMNNETLYEGSFSARNPPPLCYEVQFLPGLQMCTKFYDIHFPDRNLHMCMNFETRFLRAPILILEFDCFQMGFSGVSHQKPTESPSNSSTNTENKITFTNTTLIVNNMTTSFEDIIKLNDGLINGTAIPKKEGTNMLEL